MTRIQDFHIDLWKSYMYCLSFYFWRGKSMKKSLLFGIFAMLLPMASQAHEVEEIELKKFT